MKIVLGLWTLLPNEPLAQRVNHLYTHRNKLFTCWSLGTDIQFSHHTPLQPTLKRQIKHFISPPPPPPQEHGWLNPDKWFHFHCLNVVDPDLAQVCRETSPSFICITTLHTSDAMTPGYLLPGSPTLLHLPTDIHKEGHTRFLPIFCVLTSVVPSSPTCQLYATTLDEPPKCHTLSFS